MDIKPDETINTIITYLEKSGFSSEFYRFEPTLARSFSYSQGPIWEIVIEDYAVGSVGGGERYDGMMERLTGQKIPATGIAFGFDRTVEAADQLGLIPTGKTKTTVLVTIFPCPSDAQGKGGSPDLQGQSLKVASKLREAGINTELYPDPTDKIDKQFKYAGKKGIPFAIVIGEEELKNNTVTLKNLNSREQITLPLSEAISKLII
jgi:histidyl-tRNA synthetase